MARDIARLHIAITGGARGIGEATAERLSRAGATVVIGDRDLEAARASAARLGIRALPLDVTDAASWAAFVSEAGPLDVLVNNAGIMPIGSIEKEPEEVARAIVDVNLHGVILGTKAVVPGMIERGHGHVVNVASAVGRVPAAEAATYSASKFAVVGFSEATRLELAPRGIDVSMVLPSIVRTDLAAGLAISRLTPSVGPEEVAAVIESVIRRPRAEVWAPRWAQPLTKVTQTLPRRVQASMMRIFGADTVMTGADPSARNAYEDRIRRAVDGE